MSDTFIYKNVFMWVFVKECDNRPDGLLVRWTSGVKKTSYNTDGKLLKEAGGTPRPDYIGFVVDGDPKAYNLQIEAPQVHSYLSRVPQNVLMMAKMGGKDEETTIICEDKDGNPVLADAQDDKQGEAGWGSEPEEPYEERREYKSPALRLESMLEDVYGITSRFFDNHGRMPSDEEIRAAITLFINQN